MIKTVEEIELLLQDTWKKPIAWHDSLWELTGNLDPSSYCPFELDKAFGEELKMSSHFDGEYICRGFCFRGKLFLVEDMRSDGEDDWDEDAQVVNTVTASRVITIAMETLRNHFISQLLKEQE